jgi:leucyl aminopeptidase
MPANDLNPENFANIVKKTKFKSTKVRVFDFKDIKRL